MVDAALNKQPIEQSVQRKQPAADFTGGTYRSLFAITYNGEKNLGELGPAREYLLDYEMMRIRSWQSYLESEITQTVLNRFSTWVIGSGLKLQSEPNKVVLESEDINFDSEPFNEIVEARFSAFAKSKNSDWAKRKNLNLLSKTAFLNSLIGGDVLVVLRYQKKRLSVQLIDGCHLCSPMFGNDCYAQALENGNEIRNGIEFNSTGEHVAYYVRKKNLEYQRIPCKSSSTGLTLAYLLCGMEYRLDNTRGIPLIATVLETIKKLERYKEATVGSAEEQAKISYQVVHQAYSDGENPLAKSLAKAVDFDAVVDDIPVDVAGKALANTVAATTNKSAYNLPIGSKIETIDKNTAELYFKDFYTTNINLICAAIGIPPEVAMSKYDSNFSASRAALKDWEHTINVNRARFSFEFLQPIYNLWLHIQILENKVQADGYINAFFEGNEMVLESYRNARFVGATIPHIDPKKEVDAIRAKLGSRADSIPLITLEQATEELNGGDSDNNITQFAEELKQAKDLGVLREEPFAEPAETKVEED